MYKQRARALAVLFAQFSNGPCDIGDRLVITVLIKKIPRQPINVLKKKSNVISDFPAQDYVRDVQLCTGPHQLGHVAWHPHFSNSQCVLVF